MCPSLYASCEVTAKVGDGTAVRIVEDTDYPFGEVIQFLVDTAAPVKFPLYLRVPRWCDAATVKVNGQPATVPAPALKFIVLNREWKNGDRVTLELPMKVTVRTLVKNQEAVSVEHGPLNYSLAIEERWEKYGERNQNWPEWEVFAESPWNYGLVIDSVDPTGSFDVVRRPGPVPPQPFAPDTAPVRIKAKARRIPNWQLDRLGMVDKLQQSPARTAEPIEEVSLIPMGAARLRISTFPSVTTGAEGHEWLVPRLPKPSRYKASASHCHETDTVDALGDGLEPKSSNDHSIPRMTWWPHKSTREWVQYEFAEPRMISSVAVYWFDDLPNGGCAVPQSWRVLYRKDNEWREVTNPKASPISKDRFNLMAFDAVETKALRLEVDLQPNYSGGILEWTVGE